MELITASQREVVAQGLFDDTGSCVLEMPTGSGKTWLALQAVRRTLEAGRRAVYLAPLRALAEELAEAWQEALGGVPVGIFTGDYGAGRRRPPLSFGEARLLIMTPERMDACLRQWRRHWHWLPDVDLVVVDELHLLADPQRGPRLEGVMTRLPRLNPFVRFWGLSATLGNRQELARWLGGTDYHSDARPVPLEWHVERYAKASDKPALLRRVVRRAVAAGGRSLVFVQSRRRAEALSETLAEAGISARFHHAGLAHEARGDVEEALRQGAVDVVVATATLEMGLNLPVRQVVLYDLQRFTGDLFEPLPVMSVLQRAGRAGRLGLDEVGEVVLLAPQWDRQAGRYVEGACEPIRSGLRREAALAEQVVTEVASGLARTRPQLERALQQTLLHEQQDAIDVAPVLGQMLAAGMVEEVESVDGERRRVRLRATRYGRIAVRHLLAPATVVHLRRALAEGDPLSYLDLLLVVATSPDCEPVLPVDFEELDELQQTLQAEPSLLLSEERDRLHALGVRGKRLLSALKMALVLRAWTRRGDAAVVAERFACYPFEVERLRRSAERLLGAAEDLTRPQEAHDVPPRLVETAPLHERVGALRRMVSAGVDEGGALLTLVNGVGPVWARRLQDEAVCDLDDLAVADPERLARLRGLSLERARRWTRDADVALKEHPARWYADTAPSAKVGLSDWPTEVDPYRLRRALDLTVARAEARSYHVEGGLEPHRVQVRGRQWRCDCADAAKGHLCKHVLAVRLRRGDPRLAQLARTLTSNDPGSGLDLFRLWYQ